MPSCHTHLRSVVNEDGSAIFDTRRGTLTTLNCSGSLLWEGIERGEDEEQLVQRLTEATKLPLEQMRSDVQDFLKELVDQKLLSRELTGPQEGLKQ